jgi:hypothetical protein
MASERPHHRAVERMLAVPSRRAGTPAVLSAAADDANKGPATARHPPRIDSSKTTKYKRTSNKPDGMNRETARVQRARQLMNASKKVRAESARVNAEFDLIEREVDTSAGRGLVGGFESASGHRARQNAARADCPGSAAARRGASVDFDCPTDHERGRRRCAAARESLANWPSQASVRPSDRSTARHRQQAVDRWHSGTPVSDVDFSGRTSDPRRARPPRVSVSC